MKATIKGENVEAIRTSDRDRIYNHGLDHGYKAVMIRGKELKSLVELRISSTSSAAYACAWLYSPKVKSKDGETVKAAFWNSGSGRAGGYGYHRQSAAAESALSRAGVELSEAIGGRGDQAIRNAVEAVGKALAPKGARVFVVEMCA